MAEYPTTSSELVLTLLHCNGYGLVHCRDCHAPYGGSQWQIILS